MSGSACRLVPLFSPLQPRAPRPRVLSAFITSHLYNRAPVHHVSPDRYPRRHRPGTNLLAPRHTTPEPSFFGVLYVQGRARRLNTSNVPTAYGTFWIIFQMHLKARLSYVPLSHKPLHVGPGKGPPQHALAPARTQDVRGRARRARVTHGGTSSSSRGLRNHRRSPTRVNLTHQP